MQRDDPPGPQTAWKRDAVRAELEKHGKITLFQVAEESV
jgi:hypothetical protein